MYKYSLDYDLAIVDLKKLIEKIEDMEQLEKKIAKLYYMEQVVKRLNLQDKFKEEYNKIINEELPF